MMFPQQTKPTDMTEALKTVAAPCRAALILLAIFLGLVLAACTTGGASDTSHTQSDSASENTHSESGTPQASQASHASPVYVESSYTDERVANQAQARQAADALTDEELSARVQEILSGMDIREKVGQLILARCPIQNAAEDLQRFKFGGYVLYARDFQSPSGDWYSSEQVKKKLGSFIASSNTAPLLAVDEEGGVVQRLGGNPHVFSDETLRSPLEIAETQGDEALQSDALKKSEVLLQHGINLNLSPVVDLPTSANSFIYERSLGIDAERAAQRARIIVSGMKEAGIGSTLKHFPGYGDNGDTHSVTASDDRTREQFFIRDFVPFSAGIDAGADAVMFGHFYAHAFDSDKPASLSEATHQILRDELGFSGLIISDDTGMIDPGNYGIEESAAVAAIEAGNDMIISTRYSEDYSELLDAVYEGSLDESRVNDCVTRILRLKLQLGLIN